VVVIPVRAPTPIRLPHKRRVLHVPLLAVLASVPQARTSNPRSSLQRGGSADRQCRSQIGAPRSDRDARKWQALVNVREVPGYRTELTPFGGIKSSGLGVKEGVAQAVAAFTTVKLYTVPWP
jgi:hypothetical protein